MCKFSRREPYLENMVYWLDYLSNGIILPIDHEILEIDETPTLLVKWNESNWLEVYEGIDIKPSIAGPRKVPALVLSTAIISSATHNQLEEKVIIGRCSSALEAAKKAILTILDEMMCQMLQNEATWLYWQEQEEFDSYLNG